MQGLGWRCTLAGHTTVSLSARHSLLLVVRRCLHSCVRHPLPGAKKSIYLRRSCPPLENGLDRPKNRYGRYGFPSSYSIFISTVGVDGARVCLRRFSFLALWVVVVDISQLPACGRRSSLPIRAYLQIQFSKQLIL